MKYYIIDKETKQDVTTKDDYLFLISSCGNLYYYLNNKLYKADMDKYEVVCCE